MKSLVTELQFEQLENQELKTRLFSLKAEIKILKMHVNVFFKEVALSQSNTNTAGFIRGEVILDQDAQARVLEMIDEVIKTN
jgi:hypothetical protein